MKNLLNNKIKRISAGALASAIAVAGFFGFQNFSTTNGTLSSIAVNQFVPYEDYLIMVPPKAVCIPGAGNYFSWPEADATVKTSSYVCAGNGQTYTYTKARIYAVSTGKLKGTYAVKLDNAAPNGSQALYQQITGALSTLNQAGTL